MSLAPVSLAAAGWRRLLQMRTAIVLLMLLAAGAAVGSFFPQTPIDPDAVARWQARNAGWNRIAQPLGLFDVYGAWWFMAIYALLLVSLTGCLLRRYRAYGRALRTRPRTPASLASQPHHRAAPTLAPAADALQAAEEVLRRRRYRVTRADGAVAAERGHAREGGSLMFHTAFLLLLLGVMLGKVLGHTGQVAVVEGDRFTETHLDYDYISEGRAFGERHRGFSVLLEEFDVRWHPNGLPDQFSSRVRILEGDRPVRTEHVYVNSPITYRGVRLYQLSWGWAPHVRVTQGDSVLYDGPTVLLSDAGTWRGVVKVPGAEPFQVGLELVLFTDPDLDEQGRPVDLSPFPRRPLLVFQEYVGDLGLDRAQSVYRLDPSGLTPREAGAIPLGGSTELGEDVEVRFVGLKQYSVFQVATNPGAPVLFGAAVLILIGLLPALYSSRRRVWVRASDSDEGSTLEIAGHALQRKPAFEEEFEGLVAEIGRAVAAREPTPRPAEEVVTPHG